MFLFCFLMRNFLNENLYTVKKKVSYNENVVADKHTEDIQMYFLENLYLNALKMLIYIVNYFSF